MPGIQAFVLGAGPQAMTHRVSLNTPASLAQVIMWLQEKSGYQLCNPNNTAPIPGAVLFIDGQDSKKTGGFSSSVSEENIVTIVLPYPDS